MAGGGGAAAKTYISIVPKMDGVDKEIESALTSIANKAGDKAGRQLGKSMAKGASKSLNESSTLMGEGVQSGFSRIFEKQSAKIQQKLTEPFKDFGGQVKASFGEVGSSFGQMLSNMGGAKLSSMFGPILDGAKATVAKIGGTFAGVGSAIAPALSVAGEVAGAAFGKIASVAGPAISKMGDMAKGAFSAIGTAARDALSGIGEMAAAAFDKVATAAKVAAAASVAALAAIGKGSLDAYASFEQLEGGVNKLFGDEAAKTVMANAQNAFRTAGMSANDYMETATSFSASLINSLGGDTQSAAEMADVAMRAMSDNINTFGTDAESVQNAFQGFAKENYTMLDNLKLGYGGTKEGMKQLIDDANAYAVSIGESGDMTMDSFADQIRAIDLIQRKQHIAGTTAKETATTIEGSVAMTKAAWSNLLAEIGKDDGNVGARMEELASSAVTALIGSWDGETGERLSTGILGRLTTIFGNIADSMPAIMETLKGAMSTVASDLVAALDGATGGMASQVLGYIEPIASAWQDTFGNLATQLQPLGDAVLNLATAYLPIMQNGMVGLAGVFSDVAGAVIPSLTGSLNYLTAWISANQPLISSLGAQFGAVAVQLGSALGGAIQTVLPVLLQLGSAVIPVVLSVVQALVPVVSGVVSAFADFAFTLISHLQPAIDALLPVFTTFASFVASTVLPVVAVLVQVFGSLLGDAISWVAQRFADLLDFLAPVGEFIGGLVGGLGDALSGLADKVGISFGETERTVATSTSSIASTTATGATQISDSFTESFAGMSDDVAAQMEQVNAAVATGASGMDDKMTAAVQSVGESAAKGVDVTAMESQAKAMVDAAVAAAKSVDASSVGQAFSKSAASGIDVNAMTAQAQQMASATSALNTSATVSVKADMSGVNAIKSGAASVQASMRAMQAGATASMAAVSKAASSAAPAYVKLASTIASSMSSAVRSTQNAAASMSRALSSVRGTTVHINVARGSVQLPHFYMSGNFDPKTKAVPHVGVSWYAKGGIFPAMTPTIIGVGDARVPEVVAPIDKLASMLRDEDIINRNSMAERPINMEINGVSSPDEVANATTRKLRLLQMAEGM